MRLQGKVALVTGAASGIGRATALTFAREGARVMIADIDGAGARRVADEIGDVAIAAQFDVADAHGWDRAAASLTKEFGRLDILVNVAGIGIPGTIMDLTPDHWDRMVAVNLTGLILGCQCAIRTIITTGGSGAIITVSSVLGMVGMAGLAGYSATKGAVTTLTKSIALYCAEQKLPIRSVSVNPTYVDTDMLHPFSDAYGGRDAMLAGMGEEVPIGRIASAQDVANAILFAASDEAAMMSGHNLVIDGAHLAGLPARI